MGNAGGGNGEKGEGNDELEMVRAFIVAVFVATVANRVWRLLSRGSLGSSSIPVDKRPPKEAQPVWSTPPDRRNKQQVGQARLQAYGASRILSQSEVVEEEEKKQATSRTTTVAGRSSASHKYILESKRSPKEPPTAWSPPPEGYVKLNTDFSGPSGIGWIIKDHLGDKLRCGAERVEDCTISDDNGRVIRCSPAGGEAMPTDRGEALALLKGLEMARKIGCRKVIAETDNESNALRINSEKDYNEPLITLIQIAMKLWFAECHVRDVHRDANKCADHLAKCGPTCSYQDRQCLPSKKKKKIGIA